MIPLQSSSIIEPSRRETFIKNVFINITDLININTRLLRQLLIRQRESAVVERIGDIFLPAIDDFRAYVKYGAQQVYAKHFVEVEKLQNPEFAIFLQVIKMFNS